MIISLKAVCTAVMTVLIGFSSLAGEAGANLIPDSAFASFGAPLPTGFSLQKLSSGDVLTKSRTERELDEYTLLGMPVRSLESNRIYRFRIQVQTQSVSEEQVEVCNVEFYRQGKFVKAISLRVGKGSTPWRELSCEFNSGDKGETVRIVFFLQRRVTGTVRYRSPVVTEVKPDLKRLEKENAALDPAALPPALRPRLDAMRNACIRRMKDETDVSPETILERLRFTEWNALRQLWKNSIEFETVRPQVTAAPGFEDVLLGVASSAEKVLPRAAVFRTLPSQVELSAARNERESFQLVVFPGDRDRRNVQVRVSELKGADGVPWCNAFSVLPVGYVKVGLGGSADYSGYYPDPLMAHLDTVKEIKAGDAQAFWMRLAVPRDQAAGIYTGNVTVAIDGQAAFQFPVTVRVYDFELPDRAMLPLAITFLLKEKHLERWTDLLTGYYITPDNLYHLQFRNESPKYYKPDFELLSKMKREGSLNRFNLGYIDEALENPAGNHGMQFQIDRIRARYEQAKKLGLLEHAYIYGCDESNRPERTDLTAKLIKKEFPDIPLFTSAYDSNYGTTGLLPSWDWYCPLISVYEATQPAVENARRQGKQVWWYVCCVPEKPYPNVFVDSPLIEIRLLMGAMTAKYRPDGFLYYETTNWRRQNPAPLGDDVFTSWNPNSFGMVNGDGYWFYKGPDEIPLPSIRVEAFRDGLEDYAYHEILRGKVERARKSGQSGQWLREAEAALQIPKSLVQTLTDHTSDPAAIYRWRNRMAELIEQAK